MKEIGTFDIENFAVSSNKEKFTCTLKFTISIYMCKIIIFIDNLQLLNGNLKILTDDLKSKDLFHYTSENNW